MRARHRPRRDRAATSTARSAASASSGAAPAVALNPATPVDAVRHVLDLLDMVLVMTVNPGFGGQAYIATMEPKIAEVRELVASRATTSTSRWTAASGPSTVAGAARAGANVLVAGSRPLPRPEAGLEHAVTELRGLAEAAVGA